MNYKKQKKIQFDVIVNKMNHLTKELRSLHGTSLFPSRYKEYVNIVNSYKDMRDGGKGDTTFSPDGVRSLHFSKWLNEDFQILLETIGVEKKMPDDDWKLQFKKRRSFVEKYLLEVR